MLVLTRRIDEILLIGDDIRITVLNIQGSQVKIGIDAPESFDIVREETLVSDNTPNHSFHTLD